jgi:hypothetical protein
LSWSDRTKVSTGNRFLYASNPQDRVLSVSDVATGKEIRRIRFDESIPSFDLSPDGSLLAVALGRKRPGRGFQFGGAISVRDLATDKEVTKIQLPESQDLNELGFSRDGMLIVTTYKAPVGSIGEFGSVSTWDSRSGKKLHEWEKSSEGWQPLKIYTQDFTSMVVQERGNQFLHYVVDAHTGNVLQRFPGYYHQQEPLAFSPDTRTMIKNNCELEIWELATGKLRRRFAPGSKRQIAVQVRFSPDGKRLVTAGMDSFAHIWDLVGVEESQVPTSKDIPTLWADLRDDDAVKAGLAIRRLQSAPDLTLPFLKNHLHADSPADPPTIALLVKELDSERFAVRRRASAALEKMGTEAEPALRKALAGNPSLEVRRRIEALVEKIQAPIPPAKERREIRAVEILEYIAASGGGATPLAAVDLLKALATGAPEARLTQEAKASLRRLKMQSGRPKRLAGLER